MRFQKIIIACSFVITASLSFGQALIDWPCGGLTPGSQWTINAPCVNVSTAGLGLGADPGSCGSSVNDDGWGWFIGDGNSTTVNFTGLNSNGILHIWEVSAPPCGGITNVFCSNNGGTANESVTFNSILGTTYLIRIQRNNSNNTVTGCLQVTSTPPVLGCMDPTATNYNPLATIDDGSCTYAGVDYVHPTVGGAGEFVGSCLVNDCGPFIYTDNGGIAGNYSTLIGSTGAPHYGGIYRVFCPDVAGNCMQATFNSFVSEAGFDYLQVKNGPTQNSPEFAALHSATVYGVQGMNGNLTALMPQVFTSTDASGCLTFRFFSDGTVVGAGWNATLQCVPCAGGPNGTDNSDCQTLTPLCDIYSLPGDATGPGLVTDGCTFGFCPAGGENYSNWFTFEADNSGTLDITLTPADLNDDYDFALYGPNVTCAALGSPIRCSDAAGLGVTGTGGDVDLTEPASGNGQVATVNVIAGDTYILVVDEWSPNSGGTGFTLDFTGTATLDCSILPVELSEFEAEYLPENDKVGLHWSTSSERDNDRFEVEHSTDGINFKIINILKGAGTTTTPTEYFAMHDTPLAGINYYRLNQWDINGSGTYSEVISVNVLDDAYDMLSLFPNPTTGLTEVVYNSYTKEQVMLNVISLDGKTVVNTSLNAVRGGNRFDLDMTDQKSGVYFITITTNEKTFRSKLIKK
jgi:hypothetical protein